MKTTYAQNNTRSLFLIVASMVLALVLFAALLGLSEKPDVRTVAISSGDETVAVPAAAPQVQDDTEPTDDSSQATLQPIPDDDTSAATQAASTQTVAVQPTAVAAATAVAAPVPTIEPTATEVPEIAAAVEPLPTSLPASQATDAGSSEATDLPAAAAATTAAAAVDPTGTVTGNFFTRADEDEGATVSRNEITLTFDESGGGTFRGVLDITYANGSQVQIDMGGDFVYAPTSPQVMSGVTGTYRRDAIDDLEDVTTDSGDLSITSFVSGSGALCTPTCFGFTFPPPGT